MTSRTRIQAARTGGRGAVASLVAAGLFAACLAGPVAGGVASNVSRPAERRVFGAGAQTDTLEHSWHRVFDVARAELEKDGWAIQSADSSERRIVTRWQPMQHPLARLAFGDVWARCAVDVAPLPGGRTVVQFRGGLASFDDLASNPAFPAARLTYQRAAQRWADRVRARLHDESETAARLAP